MRPLRWILGLTSLTIAALAMPDVRAAGRFLGANATSHCQTALPVFDGDVRKRPLAVQNEGDGDVFVTCSFTAQATDLNNVRIYFSNVVPNQQVPLTCTAVTGHRRQVNQYVTKTAALVEGQLLALTWDNEDFGTPSAIPGAGLFSVSCKLPPGTGIGNAFFLISEDVGA